MSWASIDQTWLPKTGVAPLQASNISNANLGVAFLQLEVLLDKLSGVEAMNRLVLKNMYVT